VHRWSARIQANLPVLAPCVVRMPKAQHYQSPTGEALMFKPVECKRRSESSKTWPSAKSALWAERAYFGSSPIFLIGSAAEGAVRNAISALAASGEAAFACAAAA
jgi:hypothetical protein